MIDLVFGSIATMIMAGAFFVFGFFTAVVLLFKVDDKKRERLSRYRSVLSSIAQDYGSDSNVLRAKAGRALAED